jgi:hypothetical protein
MNLSTSEKILIYSSKILMSANELEQLNENLRQIADWELMAQLLVKRGVAPMLYAKRELLAAWAETPETFRYAIESAYSSTLMRSMVLYNAFAELLAAASALPQAPVIIPLKGVYLSEWLYTDIALRMFSDIDILVKLQDAEVVLGLLRQLGYKTSKSPGVSEFTDRHDEIVHYLPMVHGAVSVEVHIKLHHSSKHYAINTEAVIESSYQSILHGLPVQAMEFHDLLIHTCVHIDKHFIGGNLSFRSFTDLVNLLEVQSSTLNWEYLLQRCEMHSCTNTVMGYIVLVSEFYSVALPAAITNKYSTLATKGDKKLFLHYLHGGKLHPTQVSTHLNNISNIKELHIKLIYLWEIIFPSHAFMIQKYCPKPLKRSKNWWLWYPYRWAIGVKELVKFIK